MPVVGIKVPAMEVNVAAVVAKVTEVTVLMATKTKSFSDAS